MSIERSDVDWIQIHRRDGHWEGIAYTLGDAAPLARSTALTPFGTLMLLEEAFPPQTVARREEDDGA